MALGPKELQARALREAKASKSSDGSVEKQSRTAIAQFAGSGSCRGVVPFAEKASEIAGVASGPSEAKRGRPRLEVAHKTLAATKPWKAQGMSERTWFRRQAEKKLTGKK